MMFPYVIQNKRDVKYWIIFLILMILLILFVLLKKYDDELYFVGLNENNKIKILIKEEDIITLPNKVILNDKEFDYEIENISLDNYLDNEINYKMLTISSDYKTDEKIVNLKFIKGKTRILKEIIKVIKGGII